MDRFLSTTLFLLALAALAGAVLLLLGGFLEYLQVGRWRQGTLLDAAYDLNLVRSRWFLTSELANSLRSVLQKVPLFAALLAFAPLAWWLSRRLGSR
jgi:hypothetical protein